MAGPGVNNVSITLALNLERLSHACRDGQGLIAKREYANRMAVGLLHQDPPPRRIRRGTYCPDTALTKVQKRLANTLVPEMRDELIESIAFSNAAKINRHSWLAQSNFLIGGKMNVLAPNRTPSLSQRSLRGES